MLSLVNYGSSDSENDSNEDEKDQPESESVQHAIWKLPPVHKREIAEEDDEFLLKKAVPVAVPPKKEKVKITIPRLSDFKDDDDDKNEIVKRAPATKKTGLLQMLPRPSQSFAPAPRPKKPSENIQHQPKTSLTPVATSTVEATKKVGLVPYALMSHNPSTKRKDDSDDEGDLPAGFFSFENKDEELPKVSEDVVKAMLDSESMRLQRKRQGDESVTDQTDPQLSDQYSAATVKDVDFDAEAMRNLMGGNKAKRSKIDDIQIIDLSASEVLPNRDEWLRKTLAGETSYMPTGNIVDKGPTALSKRKHQISYLSMRAESNEAELEAMWASNRQTKRESKSKYGF